MSGDQGKLVKKWNLIKEQLVALCALEKLPTGNDEFKKLLSEDIELRSLNSQNLTAVCYFVLGIIDCEERDKLIQWPLVNIKTHTKFRKGLSIMIKRLQGKHPTAHIKKLPESYFMNPHGYQSKVLDFLLRLTNLAIHVALEDPSLLVMHSGEGLNASEIGVMREIITNAMEEEKVKMRNNLVPLEDIELAKNEVIGKCIALKQENDDLRTQLRNHIQQGMGEELISSGENNDFKRLGRKKDKIFSKLNALIGEISKYRNLSKELLLKLKPLNNPTSLSSKEFGCESSSLEEATSTASGHLCKLFQHIAFMKSLKEKEVTFCEELKTFRTCLKEENDILNFFVKTIVFKKKF